MTELSPFDEGYVAPPKPEPKADPAPPPGWSEPTIGGRQRAAPRPKATAKPVEDADDSADEPEVVHPTEIADGVYFGMVDDAYHAIERLSTSGEQKLLVSPATFWADSWLNPEKAERDAKRDGKPRMVGRAYHTARLEPHLFDATYVRALDKAEMPKATLFTGTDMGKALESLGLTKSGTVDEQAARLVEGGWRGPIWHAELAKWEKRRGTRIGLPAETFDEIVEDGRRLRATPAIAELLTGGAAEVSVFWTCQATGIPMKARLDYLKPRAWTDLKTFDNTRGKRLEQAIADAFRYNRYYVQAVSYREAVEAIRNGLVDIVGECEPWQRELINEVQLAPGPLACWYVFQEKGGVPNIVARRFRFVDVPLSHLSNSAGLSEEQEARAAAAVARPTMIARKAEVEIAHAKKLYQGYSEIYERGQPWLPIEPLSDLGDDDFNSWWLEGKSE